MNLLLDAFNKPATPAIGEVQRAAPLTPFTPAGRSQPGRDLDLAFNDLLSRAERPARPAVIEPARQNTQRPVDRANTPNASKPPRAHEHGNASPTDPQQPERLDTTEASLPSTGDDAQADDSQALTEPSPLSQQAGDEAAEEDVINEEALAYLLAAVMSEQAINDDAIPSLADASVTEETQPQGNPEAMHLLAGAGLAQRVHQQANAAVDPLLTTTAEALPQPIITTADSADTSSEGNTSDTAQTTLSGGNTRAVTATPSQAPAFETVMANPLSLASTDATTQADRADRPVGESNPLARFDRAGASANTQADHDPEAINGARLSRGLRAALNQQGGSVTLRLTPPEMGTVRIQLDLSPGNVAARFHAETDNARQLLQQQLGQLRQSLESQGLNVDRLSVQTMSSSNAGFTQDQQDASNADGRSRGQFFNQHGSSQQQRDNTDTRQRQATAFDQLFATAGADA